MANYTPTFTKPYPNGWVDKPSKTTPATAAIMNSYDTAIAALEEYLRDNAIKNVSASTTVKSGTKIATITIDGTEYVIYSPSVSYKSAITGGTKVGTITVGTNTFDVYAPTSSSGGSTVSVVPKTLTGTNIAEITVDGTTYQLYAPTGGSGSGSTVTAEATLTEGTQIGKITIDGVETILYAPTASSITVDSELSATSENPVQNKVVKSEFDKVDSNLTNLKVSDVAGGKNLVLNTVYGFIAVDKKVNIDNSSTSYIFYAQAGKTYSFSGDATPTAQGVRFAKVSSISPETQEAVSDFNPIADGVSTFTTNETGYYMLYVYNTKTSGIKFQIEEGTQATDYEPYIPSVKMLADENAQQSTDLSDIKDGTTPAAKAVADEDGNNIKSTYVKKTEVPSGSIVDSSLSTTSENPVQNKIVTAELNKKIEILDDESQAPDVVNFDLDSELSLTSTKGVQNKVIAKEFQKYATKAEVVAVEDVEVEFNSDLFSNPTYYCKCIGKMCFLYFTAAFKKSGAISHLTSLISIKNSKYYAITSYSAPRLFIGSFGGSNDLKGNLVMYNQSTIAVQSDTNTVLETEAMWGSIQWMIK